MKELKYSAGAVGKGFWFQEFRIYMELLKENKTHKEIRELQKNENVLLAPSVSYGEKMSGTMLARTKALPEEIKKLFFNLNASNQKILNLLGIMMTDRLFFEYMYEIYREDIIRGTQEFQDSNVRLFMKNKAEQSEKIEQYTDQTKKRLAGAYKTYLKEANLLIEEDGILLYQKPILNLKLEQQMKRASMDPYFRALTGGIS